MEYNLDGRVPLSEIPVQERTPALADLEAPSHVAVIERMIIHPAALSTALALFQGAMMLHPNPDEYPAPRTQADGYQFICDLDVALAEQDSENYQQTLKYFDSGDIEESYPYLRQVALVLQAMFAGYEDVDTLLKHSKKTAFDRIMGVLLLRKESDADGNEFWVLNQAIKSAKLLELRNNKTKAKAHEKK